MIPEPIIESVSPNGHFLNLPFIERDKSRKTYLENQLPKGYFPNIIFRMINKKKNLREPNLTHEKNEKQVMKEW